MACRKSLSGELLIGSHQTGVQYTRREPARAGFVRRGIRAERVQENMQPVRHLLTQYGGTVGRGILMGGADIVPGVSGGTVALILGIYERLVTAISHVDLHLLQLLGKRQWRSAARHVDLPLLVPLGAGVLIGFVIMTTLMHFLLSTQQTRSLTLAAFFGLIFASGLLVALMIKVKSRRELIRAIVAGVAGGWFAWWVAGLDAMPDGAPHLGFIFVSGAIAICAMILPGISGAMILLVLGVYIHLTEIPANILQGREVWSGLVTVAVFATGWRWGWCRSAKCCTGCWKSITQ